MGDLDTIIKKLRARDPNISFTLNQERPAINILRGDLAAPVDVTELRKAPYEHARQFLRENKSIVGEIDEANELVDERTMTNSRGMTDVVFQQKYGDAFVRGGMLSVHYNADGGMYLIKSDLAQGIDIPKEPKIPADRAIEIAKQHAGEGASLYEEMKPILEVVDAKTLQLEDKPQGYYLCWKIGIIFPPGHKQTDSFYFVDALNGEIRLVYPAIQTGKGTGCYSCETALNSEIFGNIYRLLDKKTSSLWSVSTKPIIHTYDDNGSRELTLTNYSEDSDDNWDNGGTVPINRADNQCQEVDLHRYMGYVLNYYYRTHGHNGWDGKGADSKCHAHNEYYHNNAFWSGLYHQMYFASGDNVHYNFMCPLDVVAHEFTHGVNHSFNIAQGKGEVGALNEAIADLFGALISLQHPADVPYPWMHASQCDQAFHRGRSMSDPSRDMSGVVQYDTTDETTKLNSSYKKFYPDHYSVRYNPPLPWDNSNDNGGVHVNAPIITHAVYLMIHGGTHRLSNVSVTGIGVIPVEEMLYRVISTYLSANSDFEHFCYAFIHACQDLYPTELEYLDTVKTAFYAVGIVIHPLADFRYVFADPQTHWAVIFTDRTYTNSPTKWEWKFGDGATSSLQNPAHTYPHRIKEYNVTLKVINEAGSDKITIPVSIGLPIP